jgi:hypothetical protein
LLQASAACGLLLGALAPLPAWAAMPDVPDVPGIQAAYEAARLIVDPGKHVDDLAIVEAHCKPLAATEPKGAQAACQIDFVRRLQPEGRLFFDVITLAPRPEGGWELLSGLCMVRPVANRHGAAATSATPALR